MAYRRGISPVNYTPSFLPFRLVYWMIMALVAVVCRLGFGLRVKGRENLRGVHQAIVVSNHTLVLDPGVIACALWPRRAYFTMLEETAGFPVLGTFVRLLGGVPIPGSLRALERAVAQGVRELRFVHFFPEGECFLWNQRLRPFHPGAFFIASRLGLPVVPVTVVLHERSRRARSLVRMLGARLRLPPRVTIVIGKPIAARTGAATGRSAARGDRLAAVVRAWMQEAIEREGGTEQLFRGQMPRLAKQSRQPARVEVPQPPAEERWASGA
jgi:1-acyl-sn-glycerol-3-phosphate acyltransferase